jgi:hypothetical protein
MARIVSIFQFTGRAGSAVGSKGKGGKILLRQHALHPALHPERDHYREGHRRQNRW